MLAYWRYFIVCRANLEAFSGKKATSKKAASKGRTSKQSQHTTSSSSSSPSSKQDSSSSSSSSTAAAEDKKKTQDSHPSQDVKYVGCYSSESVFVGKVYSGGTTGANFNLAYHHALTTSKKYFAVARGGDDGHSFAFDKLSKKAKDVNMKQQQQTGGGCERTCLDTPERTCGCIDDACTGKLPKGEENNRRWVVYEMPGGGK